MKLEIPELCLVALIGPSGAGKSTFAARHFKPTEVVSSDACRAIVADDPNDQTATPEAFALLNFIASTRLRSGRLTVIDATSVQPQARKSLVGLAREHDCLPVAIVLNMPESVCLARNRERDDRDFGPHVVRRQAQQLRRSIRGLKREGFRYVHVLDTPEDVDAASIERTPSWTNRQHETGPFDIIGDVHGCFDELVALLERLGYQSAQPCEDGIGDRSFSVCHPEGRKAVFVGDLVDRGPGVVNVLKLVMSMVEDGAALCVAGNHESKLVRKLKGRNVQVSHGLAESLAQLEMEPPEFRQRATQFMDGLISHYVLDGGNLVVAHAGMKEEYQGRASARVRDFCLYGETTGETDEWGLPVRADWAAGYRGQATVVYGHTPVAEPEWLNRTINVDTGCVFGGRLTALRYPENELVSVPAERVYYEPVRPLGGDTRDEDGETATHDRPANLLDIDDVMGTRVVSTRLRGNVSVREEQAAAALEVMSRFAVDPRWLVYLPPTISPCETSKLPGFLEHPAEVFDYYRSNGVSSVVCEEKHMGSRAVVVAGRSADTIERRFGIASESAGACYTRTGRRFFEDPALEAQFLERVRHACTESGLWEELETDWALLDCELMPWSMKAQELLVEQYAPVGASAMAGLSAAQTLLRQAAARGVDTGETLASVDERHGLAQLYRDAYSRYCWPVTSLDDIKLAPFHLLASEGAVHSDKDHLWHLGMAERLRQADPELFRATGHRMVNLDSREEDDAARWWEELTGAGGEGMVVKPTKFITTGKRGLAQPAIKCRGSEYLRIIYGPEYTLPGNLERLRNRGLSTKRSLALREFALGLEGLQRFVDREPMYRVHECAFAVLALESEPVDPRL
ncbi:MAG: polynucleotide kinase-phosphatase [Chloroflexota bacterium]|nr:polynucleotide kinase-phosphatase [Chloroflexota bacterium]MDE2962262.1 polynucleotide kinase-phosphatase [Chloroflexota bacterium]